MQNLRDVFDSATKKIVDAYDNIRTTIVEPEAMASRDKKVLGSVIATSLTMIPLGYALPPSALALALVVSGTTLTCMGAHVLNKVGEKYKAKHSPSI